MAIETHSHTDALDEAGIPQDIVPRLKPTEERILRYVIENRERAISDDELAEMVFEQPLAAVAREIRQARFMAGLTVAKFGIIRAHFVYFRGKFTVGMRWLPRTP